jgi:hypothetical protein
MRSLFYCEENAARRWRASYGVDHTLDYCQSKKHGAYRETDEPSADYVAPSHNVRYRVVPHG